MIYSMNIFWSIIVGSLSGPEPMMQLDHLLLEGYVLDHLLLEGGVLDHLLRFIRQHHSELQTGGGNIWKILEIFKMKIIRIEIISIRIFRIRKLE